MTRDGNTLYLQEFVALSLPATVLPYSTCTLNLSPLSIIIPKHFTAPLLLMVWLPIHESPGCQFALQTYAHCNFPIADIDPLGKSHLIV